MKQKVNGRYICVVLGILALLAGLEYVCSYFVINHFYHGTQHCTAMDIERSVDYDIEGNRFVPTGEDPQFWIVSDLEIIEQVVFDFAEPLEADTKLQVYYFDDGYSEKRSDACMVNAGAESVSLKVDGRTKTYLRFDVNGAFTLSGVTVSGVDVSRGPNREKAYWAGCILLDLFVLLLLIKCSHKVYAFACALGRFVDHRSGILEQKLKNLGRRLHLSIPCFFVIAALVGGVGYAFLLPVGQIPDEPAHVRMMEASYGFEGMYLQYYMVLNKAKAYENVRDEHLPQSIEDYRESAGLHFDKSQVTWHFVPNTGLLKYLPMAIGFFGGYLLDLPILWCAQLSELTALLCLVIIGYFALKIMPVKKELLCAVMLLPMNLQQCASINYDAVLLPLCYLLVAYALRLAYQKRRVGWGQTAIFLVLVGLIAMIKIPYALFVFLWLMIPMEQWPIRIGKKGMLGLGLLLLPVLATGVYLVRNISYVLLIRACILEPVQTLRLLGATIWEYSPFYIKSMIGYFGWFDVGVPVGFLVFTLAFLLLFAQFGNEENGALTARARIVMGAVAAVLSFLVLISMLSWYIAENGYPITTVSDIRYGMYRIDVIEGIQGRYLLPFAFCIFAFWSDIRTLKDCRPVLMQVIYYAVCFTVPACILLNRYW